MAELLTTRTSGEDEIEKRLTSKKGAASRVEARADERGPRTPLDATQLSAAARVRAVLPERMRSTERKSGRGGRRHEAAST
jgi:hypothetical protein